MDWQWRSAREVAEAMLEGLFGDEGAVADGFPDGVGGTPAGPGGPPRGWRLADHQASAVRRGRRILAERGGVVVADAVGLGKTYIALALIEEEASRGGHVLVTAPAAVMGVWRPLLCRLARRAGNPGGAPGAAGAAGPEKAAAPERARGIEAVTHETLSRGGTPRPISARAPIARQVSCAGAPGGRFSAGAPGTPGTPGTPALVVVDEAHRFRNPATRRYAALARRCVGARVVLLTATPVNNRASDLHHLLRLFAADDAFRDLGVPSLAAAFDAAEGDGCGPVTAGEVRRVVRAVVVRRTRELVTHSERDGPGDAPVFPMRAPPRIARYPDPQLAPLATAVSRLELPAYALAGGGGGVAALVRLGLLKRLDSSRAAFRQSIASHERFARAFLDAAASGRLLRPRDIPALDAAGDGDPAQLLLLVVVVEEAPPGLDLETLAAGVRRDLDRLRGVRRRLAQDGIPDPKLEELRTLIGTLAPERVLVFTEYRATAEAVWRGLARDARVGRIDGRGAWLGHRPAGRDAVVARFAPRANRRPEPPERERVDVLVATDVLSEGLNLQDARHVVSYDLPWNPVRLLQRIGRVDRLGSPHAEVVPHLFVPAHGLDRLLRLTGTLRSKLGGMAATVGADASDRLLARILAGGRDAAAALDEAARDGMAGDGAGPMEGLRAFRKLAPSRGRVLAPGIAGARPPCLVGTASIGERDALVVARWGQTGWLLERGAGGGELSEGGADAQQALTALLGRSAEADRASVPRAAGEILRGLERDVGRHFAALRATGRAPGRLRPGSSAARLARRLRRGLAGHRLAPDDLVFRVDALLRRLDHPLPAALETPVRPLLRTGPGLALPALVDRLEDLFARTADAPVLDHEPPAATCLIAVLFAPRICPSETVDGSRTRG